MKPEDVKEVSDFMRKNAIHEDVHLFGCGCTAAQETGIPITTCRRHDQRTREVKASAALMQMANALDEAGKALQAVGHLTSHERHAGFQVAEAARYAVKAAKALIGHEEE